MYNYIYYFITDNLKFTLPSYEYVDTSADCWLKVAAEIPPKFFIIVATTQMKVQDNNLFFHLLRLDIVITRFILDFAYKLVFIVFDPRIISIKQNVMEYVSRKLKYYSNHYDIELVTVTFRFNCTFLITLYCACNQHVSLRCTKSCHFTIFFRPYTDNKYTQT
jgi:hypothetical protein